MTTYDAFITDKYIVAPTVGIEVDADDIHPSLFGFQRDIVRWSLRKGRAAVFADTGLGKTRMQIEWSRLTGEKTLILAPLAVAEQTGREAQSIGVDARYAATQDEAIGQITITNYDRLHRFDPGAFGAVVLDESSILKNFEGATRSALITAFSDTPYRLCCTATPAPNDTAEIANHAEFLGIMSRVEMLAAFFVHDDEGWRIKGHARDAFWRWMASWSMSLKRPSDIGYPDDGYDLPALSIESTIIPTTYVPDGQLFATGLKGVGDRAAVRKQTIAERVGAAAEMVNGSPDEQWLCWVGLNDESRALTDVIPGAVEVQGSDSPEKKTAALAAFAAGDVRVLVTKTSIAGFGLNFQRCARMVFVGLSDSYEQYYQAIRRCWRFGQDRPVTAHVVLTDLETGIYHNILRKEREAHEMGAELVKHVAQFERAEIGRYGARTDYRPSVSMRLPHWLMKECIAA